MRVFLTFLSLVAFSLKAHGKMGFNSHQISFSTGTVSTSYTEKVSELEGSTAEPDSNTATTLPFDITYEFFTGQSRSYFVKGLVPMISPGEETFFTVSGGINFYIKSLSSIGVFKSSEIELKIVPKWRYFWGINAGIGTLTYTTQTSKELDQTFEVGLHGGLIYNLSSKWGVRAEGSYNMGTGIKVASTTTMKILLGASYYLE
ncbi:MAG: hypothetical protein ACPGJV_09185 [Bacteriovoracaceae bacterium]